MEQEKKRPRIPAQVAFPVLLVGASASFLYSLNYLGGGIFGWMNCNFSDSPDANCAGSGGAGGDSFTIGFGFAGAGILLLVLAMTYRPGKKTVNLSHLPPPPPPPPPAVAGLTCANCSQEMSPTAQFCQDCGTSLQTN